MPAQNTPVILQGGFRIMFMLAALWAVLSMLLWIVYWTTGVAVLPEGMEPVDWHVHSLLYGFAPAVFGGFLLTAIPNWTGRPMLKGGPLGLLALLWLCGRVSVWLAGYLPVPLIIVLDGGFLAVLLVFSTRELLASGNKRNLPVLGVIFVHLTGLIAFDLAAYGEGYGAGTAGARLSMGAILVLLGLIGGRIVPAFTRNWLVKQGAGTLPIMFNRYDKLVVLGTVVALAAWVIWPWARVTGIALLLAGAAHLIRMTRWHGQQTLKDPIVVMLHIAYLFVPAGFVLTGLSVLLPAEIPVQAGQHAWLAGAMGGMMLAVMTRASLGHTGRPLIATWRENFIYGAVLTAALSRVATAFPTPPWLLHLSATAWILAFLGFAVFYAPVLLRARRA